MEKSYQNKYGSVTFELVSDCMPVSKINSKIVPDGCFFDTNTSEEIVLITANRNFQLCPTKGLSGWLWYAIIHETSSTGYIAKIKDLNFISDVNPQNEIEYLNKFQNILGHY
jgi:hypothetical protein